MGSRGQGSELGLRDLEEDADLKMCQEQFLVSLPGCYQWSRWVPASKCSQCPVIGLDKGAERCLLLQVDAALY